jgi:hypothetical protein
MQVRIGLPFADWLLLLITRWVRYGRFSLSRSHYSDLYRGFLSSCRCSLQSGLPGPLLNKYWQPEPEHSMKGRLASLQAALDEAANGIPEVLEGLRNHSFAICDISMF